MKFYNDVYFELIERNFGCILEYVNYANIDVENFLEDFCQSHICKEIENGNHIFIDTSALTLATRTNKSVAEFYENNEQPIVQDSTYFKAGQILVWLQRKLNITFLQTLQKISIAQIMEEIENTDFYNKEEIVNLIVEKLK